MFVASGWRDAGVQTIWLSVFGSVKFVGGPSRDARGFWDEFSHDAMPGHVSLAPSKRSQPVTADISSALQASFLPKVFLSWGLSKKHADTLLTHLIFLPL